MKEQRTYFQGEIRATGDGLIHGKISYGTLSQDFGGFTEIVNRGAFDDSINSGKEIFALWGHDANQPLGSTRNGSFTLRDKADGPHFTIKPADTTAGRDALKLVKSGVVIGCSFGFNCIVKESPIKGRPL